MRASLLAYTASACLLTAFAPQAHATYYCDAPTQITGANDGRNPVVATRFGLDDKSGWFADHKMRDGTVIHRADQYTMMPLPTDQGVGWNGYLKRASHLYMVGWISNITGVNAGIVTYNEALRDSAKGNAIIMQSWTTCYAEKATAPATVQAATPAPQPYVATPVVTASTGSDSVPFFLIHNAMHIQATIGGVASDMMIDTGANISSVTPALAATLLATGQATEDAPVTVTMADNTTHQERTIKVKTLTIGKHTRYDVPMSVSEGTMLLGFPILNAIGKFTIDGATSSLIFG